MLFCQAATAQDVLTLGVFAYRPKPVMEKQYQPLANYLGQRLPDHDIRLRILTQNEMESALDKDELDLVFTNPSHFTQLRLKNNLTGAIATLVALERGMPVSTLGGVIFTASGHLELRSVEDLRGHRLAIPGSKYLGGYQAQAYDLLQRNIHLP